MPSEIQDIFWAPHIYRGLCWFCVFPRIFQGPVGRLRISCYLTHSPIGVMGPHSNSECAHVQKLNILCFRMLCAQLHTHIDDEYIAYNNYIARPQMWGLDTFRAGAKMGGVADGHKVSGADALRSA